MRTSVENIRIIGDTDSIDELNAAYNEMMLISAKFINDTVYAREETEKMINHITNYNIVRIANKAYDEYLMSGRSDNSRLIVISQCRDSLKLRDGMEAESGLLNRLCDQLGIR